MRLSLQNLKTYYSRCFGSSLRTIIYAKDTLSPPKVIFVIILQTNGIVFLLFLGLFSVGDNNVLLQNRTFRRLDNVLCRVSVSNANRILVLDVI